MNAEAIPSPSSEYLEDLAALLARNLTRGNIGWLGTAVLGHDVLSSVGNDLGAPAALAKSVVDELARVGRVFDAVALLRKEASRNSHLLLGLNYIQGGRRLADNENLQAFMNQFEPFMSAAGIQETLPRVLRAVCAIGLVPEKGIVGSGFLVGPDLVMTAYHVLATFLKEEAGRIVANGKGTEILCFFDYLWEPRPAVPQNGRQHPGTSVTANDNWLVYARKNGINEGKATCRIDPCTSLDYAVIRLASPVGSRPARTSGGDIRGWLTPKDRIDVDTPSQRILVFQHPGGQPQQFDVGNYEQLDPSATRVWYSVSTAKGSSGGATVATDGELFALHNAEVDSPPNRHPMNQGVRIDLIHKDFTDAGLAWTAPPATAQQSLGFWSLNDDPVDSRPIIGRERFRDYVYRMNSAAGERVLVVSGAQYSGVRFSVKLLRRALGAQVPVAIFSPKDLAKLGPRDFLTVLTNELGVVGSVDRPIPEPQPTENLSRWLRLDLTSWLRECLELEQARAPLRYPAWIVIDTLTVPGERLLWADQLRELVAALAGARDEGQRVVDIPQLRWLFLVWDNASVPLTGIRRCDDDLRVAPDYASDFASCLQLAWKCVDSLSAALDPDLLKNIARYAVDTNSTRSRQEQQPLYKVLADLVRRLIVKARPEGGT